MTSSNPTPTELPPELAQIAAEAQAIEPPPLPEGAAPGEVAAPVDYLTDAQGLADFAAQGLAMIYPSTEAVLHADRRAKFAQALAPVMEKYGLSLGVVFGRWGAEINLAFVSATMALPLLNAIQADRAAAKAEKAQAETVSKNPDPQPARPAADPYAAAFAAEPTP